MKTIPLNEARMCLNCEIIHTGWNCPVCAKGPSYFLTSWIKPAIINRVKENFYEANREGEA